MLHYAARAPRGAAAVGALIDAHSPIDWQDAVIITLPSPFCLYIFRFLPVRLHRADVRIEHCPVQNRHLASNYRRRHDTSQCAYVPRFNYNLYTNALLNLCPQRSGETALTIAATSLHALPHHGRRDIAEELLIAGHICTPSDLECIANIHLTKFTWCECGAQVPYGMNSLHRSRYCIADYLAVVRSIS